MSGASSEGSSFGSADVSSSKAPPLAPQPPVSVAPPGALTKQQVCDTLDSIPTFNLVDAKSGKIVGSAGENGEECVRWWLDADEAGSALVVAQLAKPDLNLRLAVTPLGTAFALTEGWQSTPSLVPLRLHASKIVVAGVADDLGASADNVVPIFFCDELGNARVRPFFTSRNDLRDTWVAAGRTAESVPTEVTVVDLKSLVSKMRAGFAGIDWKTSMFIASQSSIAKAQEIQEVEAKEKGKEFDAEAEPPPLE